MMLRGVLDKHGPGTHKSSNLDRLDSRENTEELSGKRQGRHGLKRVLSYWSAVAACNASPSAMSALRADMVRGGIRVLWKCRWHRLLPAPGSEGFALLSHALIIENDIHFLMSIYCLSLIVTIVGVINCYFTII